MSKYQLHVVDVTGREHWSRIDELSDAEVEQVHDLARMLGTDDLHHLALYVPAPASDPWADTPVEQGDRKVYLNPRNVVSVELVEVPA